MMIVEHGTAFRREPGTDRQSCAFPQVAVLPGGRWLVSCRAACTKGGKDRQHVMLAASDDEGRTWRLAMVYVDRTGAPAIRCRTSADAGRTWPEESMLTLYESVLPGQTVRKDGMADAWSETGKFSVGLPATAALPNGDFLVVYYAGPSTDCTSVEWARVKM